MEWNASQLAEATSGAARSASTSATWSPVVIDSRRAEPGCVFVALVAERDGHEFIPAALGAGAGAYLYQPDRVRTPPESGAEAIAVLDTTQALRDLGVAARRRLGSALVVGITGSVGKTSTKDLTAAVLGAGMTVSASEQSFNNELGVPITLANASSGSEAVVVEMGARGIGHIAFLCAIAKPTVAVVTAVAPAHTEMFGSVEAIALAKRELVEALDPSGTAVLNADYPLVASMAGVTKASVIRYGVARAGRRDLDVVAESVELDEDLRASFVFNSPWGRARVKLGVHGEHNVGNALAALSVGLGAGVDLDSAVNAVGNAGISRWRMELNETPLGVRVLNDAYNANPASMQAALQSFARLEARRKVAVLGLMAELGGDVAAEHRKIALLAADLGIEVLAVGTGLYGVQQVADPGEAFEYLSALTEGDAVLVKGSRVAGLERVAQRLLSVEAKRP